MDSKILTFIIFSTSWWSFQL